MNRKAIKSVLRKEINNWLESIEDTTVRELAKEDAIVTGGAIVNMLMGEPVKDFDIYFKTKTTVKAITKYYVKKFKEKHPKMEIYILDGNNPDSYKLAGKQYDEDKIDKTRIAIFISSKGIASEDESILTEPFEDVCEIIEKADDLPASSLENKDEPKKYRPIFLSSNAITLSNKIQLVIRFHGNPEEIHANYDFVHCTNYWESGNNQLCLKQNALESIITKELKYVGSKYPLCSILRMRKFIKRGWHINAGQVLKILFQVSSLDLTDIAILEDQLIGVDSAYFSMLINALSEKQKSDPDFNINYEYVSTIVDKIFN